MDHARINAEEAILDILIPDNASQSPMGFMSEANSNDPGEQERKARYLGPVN